MPAKPTITYRITAWLGLRVIGIAEWLINRVSSNQKFFDTRQFNWVAEVEAQYPAMRVELDKLLADYQTIPEMQNLSVEQARIISGNRWKSYFLYAYGARVNKNCAACPATAKTVESIPGMVTAFYSILEAHTRLQGHRGPYKGVMRYHLAMIVPQQTEKCAIDVAGQLKHWQQGKSLIFDDSYYHEAWNDSDEIRVVLFVDFVRPLPFPVSVVNRVVIWLMQQSPFIQQVVNKV